MRTIRPTTATTTTVCMPHVGCAEGDVWVKSFHVLFKYPSDIHFRILCFHSNHKILPLAMGMLAHVIQPRTNTHTHTRNKLSLQIFVYGDEVHFSPCFLCMWVLWRNKSKKKNHDANGRRKRYMQKAKVCAGDGVGGGGGLCGYHSPL